MKAKRHLGLAAAAAAIVTMSIFLVWAVGVQGVESAPTAWSRQQEPVILTGGQLPLVLGAPLDELYAYAYDGDAWAQIPFQIDEVDASGVYTVENGLLDENDELVFMAMDLGVQADPLTWIEDADSRNYSRYQVGVANPLNLAEQGWVYVYRSTTLAPGFADYVDWDEANDRVLAGTYIAGFAPGVHPGLDSLELNGSGIDSVDRSKIRIEATCWLGPIPVSVTLTEEDLSDQSDAMPDIDGPVRVGSGNAEGVSWYYHSLYGSQVVFHVDDLEPPVLCSSMELNTVRISVDWLDPAITGMAPATYYDSNVPGGLPIDGSPDNVPTTPAITWEQVSGGQGSVVQVVDVTLGGGTLTNYYKDDQTTDPDDTGDGQSFGDAGFRADDPAGEVAMGLLNFVLDPGQPNVGALYRGYHENPLEVTVVAQREVHMLYLPLLSKQHP
jgi:hypothetical protein